MIYAFGTMDSLSFPGFQERIIGRPGKTDIFVARLYPSGRHKAAALRIGGTGAEIAAALDVDASGDLYLAGTTYSLDFPATASQRVRGQSDGFVVKVSPDWLRRGRSPVRWCRLVGGSQDEHVLALSAGMPGSVFAGGRTGSKDFPISPDPSGE